MKVLYFQWFSGATELLRLTPLDYIDVPHLEITRTTETNINFGTISAYDVIIIERPSSWQSLSLIKLAKDMGKKVVIDFDDNVLAVDEYNPMYETYIQEKRNMMECIALADEVWVSTLAIKHAFRLYNLNVHVIPNAHNDTLYPIAAKRKFKYNKIALWRGGSSHTGDMYDGDTPQQVISMVNDNPDWTFKFVGQRFEYMEKRCGKNYEALGGASTIQFYHMIHNINPSIGFYPLADTLFNRSKSAIFFQELTYAGAAVFGNKALPEFDKRGILQFDEHIVDLSEESLRLMNELSWEMICDELLLSKVNKLREERLLSI